MWPVPVVVMQPAVEGVGALFGAGIGAGVGPLAQGGLHETLGLAVGAWGVGARAQVAHTKPTAQAAKAA